MWDQLWRIGGNLMNQQHMENALVIPWKTAPRRVTGVGSGISTSAVTTLLICVELPPESGMLIEIMLWSPQLKPADEITGCQFGPGRVAESTGRGSDCLQGDPARFDIRTRPNRPIPNGRDATEVYP